MRLTGGQADADVVDDPIDERACEPFRTQHQAVASTAVTARRAGNLPAEE
jgi:hypothetical protein